jgi:FtsZ-interacting cell division protein ZipA
MNTTTIIILAIVLVLIAVAAFFYFRRRRSENLRKQFGPEYKRAVKQYGDQGKAEAELAEREKRVRKLDIRGLTRDEKNQFADNWKKTQARFVDAPSPAVGEADSLVKELMLARRYPVGEFDQRAADISVDHPGVVNNYRNAHEIAERNKSGKATTEDLRQAMVHYRSLFEELLETTAAESSNRSEQTKHESDSKEVAR